MFQKSPGEKALGSSGFTHPELTHSDPAVHRTGNKSEHSGPNAGLKILPREGIQQEKNDQRAGPAVKMQHALFGDANAHGAVAKGGPWVWRSDYGS